MKMSIRKTKLAFAISTALMASAVSMPASAVNLTDNGLGEVILSPYYTVRNGYDTYLSVVNTSDDRVVAFKIRFRESDNSRDARDFIVFLSPNDVWTAVVTMGDDGETPVVQTADNSCTAPALSASAATTEGMRGVAFTNIDYTGDNADTGETSIERTTDGHFEIIAMGSATVDKPLAAAAVHKQPEGVPANCQLLINTLANEGVPPFKLQYDEPINTLKGAAALIKVDEGKAIGIPVSILANFFNPNGIEDLANLSPEDIFQTPAADLPNLNDAFPALATLVTNQYGPMSVFFDRGVDAVSALFMTTEVINEYAIGGAANAETDWIVTYPTKQFYVDADREGAQPALPPFNDAFQADGQSCEVVSYNYFNREEREPSISYDLDFSPAPPGTPKSAICQEVMNLSFAEVSVLNGNNLYGVPLAEDYTSGWMRLQFPEARTLGGPAAILNPVYGPEAGYATFTGYPVFGFSFKTLENGVANDNMLNYGIQDVHAYTRDRKSVV